MTTLTQSELDAMRERTHFNMSPLARSEIKTLFDHIAQLTAERDETRAENDQMAGILDDRCAELGNAQARIAELEAHKAWLVGDIERIRRTNEAIEEQNLSLSQQVNAYKRAELEAQPSAQKNGEHR